MKEDLHCTSEGESNPGRWPEVGIHHCHQIHPIPGRNSSFSLPYRPPILPFPILPHSVQPHPHLSPNPCTCLSQAAGIPGLPQHGSGLSLFLAEVRPQSLAKQFTRTGHQDWSLCHATWEYFSLFTHPLELLVSGLM